MKKRNLALIAGISLMTMAVAAMFAYGYVLSNLEVAGDPISTLTQIKEDRMLFSAGLGGWLIIFITDLLVSITLFYFFRDSSRNISTITAVLRLIYTLSLGVALLALFSIIPILNRQAPDAMQDGIETMQALERFRSIWSAGLIIFGLHLIGLGYLSIAYDPVPKLLGYLLYIAGLGYLIVHGARALELFPVKTIDLLETILMLPMALGEILLAIWLIIRGGKTKKMIQS